MASKWKTLSVYPKPRAVHSLGGYRSRLITKAVECWSAVIDRASAENEKFFTRDEWKRLADIFWDTELDPEYSAPADSMSNFLVGEDITGGLMGKIMMLDYARAWAVLWAIQAYKHMSPGRDMESYQWWTASFRRRERLVKVP